MSTAEQLKAKEQELANYSSSLAKERADLDEKTRQLNLQRQRLSEEGQRLAQQQVAIKNQAPSTQQIYTTVVTGTIGNIAEFSLQDEWSLWYERFEQYVLANDIQDGKKVALFLTLIGSEAYALLRNLCTPALPSSKTISELSEIMQTHLQPKPSIITERYKFKECRQKDSEDVKMYLANLKKAIYEL